MFFQSLLSLSFDLLNTDLKNTSTTSKVLVKREFRPELNPCKNSGMVVGTS